MLHREYPGERPLPEGGHQPLGPGVAVRRIGQRQVERPRVSDRPPIGGRPSAPPVTRSSTPSERALSRRAASDAGRISTNVT